MLKAVRGGIAGGIGLAAVAVLPPSVLASYRWGLVSRNPSLAAAPLDGYEVLVVAVGFAGLVWRNLRGVWAERLALHIDQAAGRRFSSFERRYRDYIRQSYRFIEQKGLATLVQRTPELDDVFVDLGLAGRAPQQVSGSVLSEPPAHVTERRSLWDFLGTKVPSPVVLAIVGAPGSGKTTLLRHAARRLCEGRALPVLLPLRDSSELITRDPEADLPSVIAAGIRGVGGTMPAAFFDRRLQAGRCVIMLDGLDEIACHDHRQGVVDWVDKQIARYPRNSYLITSRPHGYKEYPLERATVLQVRCFSPAQIAKFVQGWYVAVEEHCTRVDSEHVSRRAREEAHDLLARLQETPALADLATNPLLLTMICHVHRYRGGLPGTRAELYAEMLLVLLGRRKRAKKLADPLRPDQKEVVLREVAFTMMRDRVRDLSFDRLVSMIGSVLPRVCAVLTPADYLADVCANGLLLDQERDVFCFAHHTFQEYLAAACVRDKRQLQVLTSNVGDPWWRETTLLYAARADAGPIIEACLGSGRVSALALAFDCADVASELAPELRARLDALLSEAANPAAPQERRRLAAAVVASRELRRTNRLANGTQVCAAPVTRDLYQLFAEELRTRRECRDPGDRDYEGPPGGRDPAGRGPREREPRSRAGTSQSRVADVSSAAEVAAFVEWLNVLLEGDMIYRVPTRAETEDPVFSGNPVLKGRCVWFTSDNASGNLELWTAPETPHPYSITSAELLNRVRADVTGPVWALIMAIFTLALAHTLAYAQTCTRTGRLFHSRGIAVALANALAVDLEPYLELDFGRNLDLISIRDLARRLAIDSGVHCPRDLARAFDLVIDNARGTPRHAGCVRDLARAFDLAVTGACDLAVAFDSAGDGARGVTRAHDLTLALELPMCVFLARIPPVAAAPWAVPEPIWRILPKAVAMKQERWSLHQDTLSRQAQAGYEEILNIEVGSHPERLVRVDDTHPERLVRRLTGVARRINDVVCAVGNPDQQVSPELASYVRLGALAITASADQLGVDAGLAHRYAEIAAGITILERQRREAVLPRETIVLVRS